MRMTNNETIAVLDNETKCVNRRARGECNGGTDCQTCELVLPDYMILSAYNKAIKLLDVDNIKDTISKIKKEREENGT